MDPTKETKVERERLFTQLFTELQLEDYTESNQQVIWKKFYHFHQEVIHGEIQIKARKAFATLIKEETDLPTEEIQTYLYKLQQEIFEFKDKRSKYLTEQRQRKQQDIPVEVPNPSQPKSNKELLDTL